MHPTHTKEKLATFCRFSLFILIVWLMPLSAWRSHAQSGRQDTQSQDTNATSKDAPVTNKNKKEKELPTSFIVATAPPDHPDLPFVGYSPTTNFEYLARGGCLVELKGIPGVKVIEDEDVERWEARQTALAEDKSWLIWMELRWDTTSSRDTTPFRLRYLLFEPKTGRMVASGYGNGIRKTWGTTPRPTTLEEQVREAGRDIAYQVISELKRDQ